MRVILLIILCFELCGCAMVEGNRMTQADNQKKFYVGMPISEVIHIVGREPNSFNDVYKTENTSDGVYKTWVVNGAGADSPVPVCRIYNFKFKDDKLISWGWK